MGIFGELGIGSVLYIGGNDSMDTIHKLSLYGDSVGSPVRFVGVPKTIDNDLVGTDHTPGFGSAAKFIATTMIVGNAVLLAGPVDTVARLAGLIFDASFLSTVGFSLVRIAGGFVVAFASAVMLALAAHRWRLVEDVLAPAVAALKSVPIVCIIVLLLMVPLKQST